MVNVYGPNRDNKVLDFYHLALQSLKQNDFDEIENIIMGRDFNCPLNPIIDKRGENLIPRQGVINTIESLQSELDLHDIWRVKNPTRRSFTWSQPERLIGPIYTRDGSSVWDELGQRTVVRLIIRLCINTGLQTDHPSRRTITVVRLDRRTTVDNSSGRMIRLSV